MKRRESFLFIWNINFAPILLCLRRSCTCATDSGMYRSALIRRICRKRASVSEQARVLSKAPSSHTRNQLLIRSLAVCAILWRPRSREGWWCNCAYNCDLHILFSADGNLAWKQNPVFPWTTFATVLCSSVNNHALLFLWGYAVRNKQEGRGFYSRWSPWNFSVT